MKIIYNNFIPFKPYSAIMLFGKIYARKAYGEMSAIAINHEEIHNAQAKDAGNYIKYYWKYVKYWIKYGYLNSPYEREAYTNMGNLKYLETRLKNSHLNYINK